MPIGAHQGVAHPLAQAKIEIELAALMTHKAAWLHDRGRACGRGGRTWPSTPRPRPPRSRSTRPMQAHGGNGMATEYGLLPTYWGRPRRCRIAPVNREMILNYVAQHSLGLPRSY